MQPNKAISFPHILQEKKADAAPAKATLLVLGWIGFIALYLLVGAINHDPWWKRGETYSFGIVYNFYLTHTWLLPFNAGNVFLEKPPLYYWTAVIFGRLFESVLPLHDAARLASVFYTCITLGFTWKTAQLLYARYPAHLKLPLIALLLLMGSYGFLRYSHALFTDVALTGGTAIALYGMALICMAPRRFIEAGIWTGLGIGVAFMSKGLFIPGILSLCGIFLSVYLPQLRSRHTLGAVLIALFAASPFIYLWPHSLYLYDPVFFKEWLWGNNIGRFSGESVDRLGAANRPFYFLWLAPVFAFPVFPFACIEAFLARKSWRQAEYLLPFTVSLTGMTVLLLSASGRAPYLLPLMPAFCLLSAPLLLRIPQRALFVWNRGICIIASLALIGVWIGWWIVSHPSNGRLYSWILSFFGESVPNGYLPGGQWLACLVALGTTFFWCFAQRGEMRTAFAAARLWFIAATALWCSIYTLYMPWINEGRSFRTVLGQLELYLQHSPYKNQCIGNYHLGENIAPMLQYLSETHIPFPMQTPEQHTCPLLLTFADKNIPADAMDTHWTLVWTNSSMPNMKSYELRLYALATPQPIIP